MKKLSDRYQRTLANTIEIRGVGFLTGLSICVRFKPAPPSTGIVLIRRDLDPPAIIPARVDQVTGTSRRTTLGTPPAHVGLVEHVLAALAGLRIDNCIIELDGPELPGLDGSAFGFVEPLQRAGVILQGEPREIWTVTQAVRVEKGGATLTLYPATANVLRISYMLDYGLDSPLGRQTATENITPENFATSVAGCRTFLLYAEAAELRRQGLGARTTTADLVVFGPDGPIDNRLRHANEPARHKVLDIIGDLALLGVDLRGHVVAYRSGHPLNIALAELLHQKLCRTARVEAVCQHAA